MNNSYEFGPDGRDNIVYITSVDVVDLPKEMQEQAQGAAQLYAVCTKDGERSALVKDRTLAFVLARQNDLAPVAVH
ncbi:hypothetical protein JI58_02980 [Marinosulfonomonas sp. PRT-SC04]|nr:hypothetical protein JI58_02980 [Marinosulfonomonas sp. PRT-SC04]